MNTINDQEQTIIAPLGKALQAARLTASLSIAEVAEQLNLSVSTLRDIEEDLDNTIANQKYAVIYLRGYLTNYAKLVGLGKLNQFIEYQQLAENEKKAANLRAPMILPPPVKKRSKQIFVLIFILLVGAGFYLLLLQQDFFSATVPLSPDRKGAEINSENSLSDTKTINRELQIFVSENDDIFVSENDDIDADAETPPLNEATQESSSGDPEETQEPSAVDQETVAADAVDITLPDNEVTAQSIELVAPSTLSTESLQLTFSANCWTEIFDATGKRLAFDLYKAGSSLTVNGVPPFELKLGDPSGVQIQYQDKIINREFALGHSARFNIPQ